MKVKGSKLLILTLLAFVFTIALTYATIEAPKVITYFFKPNYRWGWNLHPVADIWLVSAIIDFVRPIGYACLIIVMVLIVVGFMTGRGRLLSLGSVAFFLPTFGYFALTMFYLAGVGVLRALWMPFWDTSSSLLKLGDAAYIPYMVFVYPLNLVGLDIRMPLVYASIGLGLLLFFLGTVAWFYGRFEGVEVFDFWIYRYSRHSQYLGYIVWSYGIMLLATLSPVPEAGNTQTPSFPWLISSLIVVCVALTEEIDMAKRYGERYLKYRAKVAFMIPLPRALSSAVTAPIRIMFKRSLPDSGREIIYTFVVYGVILILISLPFIILKWPPGMGWTSWPAPFLRLRTFWTGYFRFR